MTLNKILRWCIYGGLFAVLITPLIVTPGFFTSLSLFFPFITGKNFFFRIVVEIIFGLWLVLAYRDKTARPKSSWILWSLTGYLVVMTLATVFGEYPLRSFWSNFERMGGLLSTIHAYLFFLVAVAVLKSGEIWRRFLQTSLAVSLAISWIGLLQLFGKAEIHQSALRLDATLGNSAYLAVYLLFHVFLSIYLLITSRHTWSKWLYGIIAVVETLILFYTQTRGAVLGLVGGAIVFCLLIAWKKPGPMRKGALSVLGAIVVLIVLFIAFRNTALIRNNPTLSRFASLSWNDSSILARKQIWTMGWEGAQEHPLLGWGPENFPFVFQKYYTAPMWGQEPWFDRSHNIVLDNLVDAGGLGLLAYLSIFAAALYYLFRRREGENDWQAKALLIGLLAGYFAQNLTVFDQLISVMMFYLVLGFIHFQWAEKDQAVVAPSPVRRDAPNEEGAWLPFVVLGSVVLTVFSVYYFNYRGINTSASLIRAISPAQNSAVTLGYFEQIFARDNVVGLSEAREQLMNTAGNVLRDSNAPAEVKQKYLLLVTAQMTKQFVENDADARTHLFYGGFWQGIGDGKKAIDELEKALQLSPAKQMILIQLGSAYINDGQIEKGMALFKQAYEEEPTYLEARRLYALAALYTGNSQLSDQILGDKRMELINDERFLNYYAAQKRYDLVLAIRKWQQAANPKDKQTNMSLAAAYYYAGDRATAVKVVQDYITIDPSFAGEGDQLIKQIELGQIK